MFRMSFVRFTSVIVREPFSFRQVFSVRTIFAHGFATHEDTSANVVVPPNAFKLFSREKRGHVGKDDYPDKTAEDITKNLPDKWKGMLKNEKSTYKKMYAEQMVIFNYPVAELRRKPPGPFGLFVKDNYSKVEAELIPEAVPREVLSRLSSKWKCLSNTEKEQLKQKHDAMKKEYKQEVMRFWQRLTTEERAFLEEKHGPEMRQLAHERRKILGYPRSPLSPFVLFVQRSTAVGLENTSVVERTKMLGQKWKDMSDEEKEVYFEENRQAHERYNKDVAIWKEKHPEAV